MLADYEAENTTDANGNPTGGYAKGTGMDIQWQDGPLAMNGTRQEPNGAFVETVIHAAKSRIEFYQASRFACRENALAITKLDEALLWLNARTLRRTKGGIEGTHQTDKTEAVLPK